MKSLDELRAAFQRKENDGGSTGAGNYYPFWNLDYGQSAIIRFLPDKNEDNPLGFMVEKHMHNLEINGETKKIPCLKMYDEDCPICKVSSDYYKEDDKENGKKYWRKKQYIAQALIISDPIEHRDTEESHEGEVRYISMGYQLYNVIKEAFESGDLDEIPFAFEGGCNFTIKKSKQGEYATYAVGSRFARKSTDLTEDEIEFVEEEMIDLSTLLPEKPNVEKVEGQLRAALTGAEYKESTSNPWDENEDEDEDEVKPKKTSSKKKKPVAEDDEDDVVEDDEFGESGEADDILTRIRSRRGN